MRQPLADLHHYTPYQDWPLFACPHCGRNFRLQPGIARARTKGGKKPCCSTRCGQLHRKVTKEATT